MGGGEGWLRMEVRGGGRVGSGEGGGRRGKEGQGGGVE